MVDIMVRSVSYLSLCLLVPSFCPLRMVPAVNGRFDPGTRATFSCNGGYLPQSRTCRIDRYLYARWTAPGFYCSRGIIFCTLSLCLTTTVKECVYIVPGN